MLSVLDNAYLRKAQENEAYDPTQQKILLLLLHEKKYYTKDELLCCTNHSLKQLENALKELQKTQLVKTEGWLVKIAETSQLYETIAQNKPK